MLKNRKVKWVLLFALCSAIFLTSGFESRAENVSGEQTISQEEFLNGETDFSEEITMMDENGNIIVIGDTDGIIESSGMAVFSRTAPVRVVNFNTKNGLVTEYKEYLTGAAGYTNGDYGADAAYLGTENGKVKFMLSGVVGLVAESEVQVVNLTDVKAVSYYIVQNGRLWHRIVHNMNQSGYISALDQGPAPSYLTSGQEYYSYDGHYFYADYAVMLDDYVSETRSNSVNAANPYYNYYQYLPLRSTVTYTGAELTSLINAKAPSTKMTNLGSNIISFQNTYGVNGLLISGIAANESAWGTSSICKEKNNLFGINAVDTSPGTSAKTFETPGECVRQFAETYMSKRYLRPGYTYYHGGFLGNKASGINVSYASDPYWGEKAANAAWTLDKNGGSKDFGRYTIGIKDTIATKHNSVNVRSASNTSSTALYKTGVWTSYAVLLQKNAAENGFYKIQSDGVINEGRSAITSLSGNYNIGTMYAYIHSDYVTIVHKGENVSIPVVPELTSPELVSAEYKGDAVTVTWKKVSGAEGYNIHRKVKGGSWSKIGTVAGNSTLTYNDTTVEKGTEYVYTVRAYVGSTLSGFDSAGVSVKIPEAAKTYTKYKTTSSVNYRTGPGTSYTKSGTFAKGTEIEVEDGYSKTANGYTWYRFKLNSKDYYIASQYITKVVESFGNPELVSAKYSSGSVTVTWKKVSGAEGYNVYRKLSGGNWSKIAQVTSQSTVTYKDTESLTKGKTYVYTIRAYKGSTLSGFDSKGVSVKIPEDAAYITGMVTSLVNYRSGPSLSAKKIGTLAQGQNIKIEKGYSKKADGYTWYRFKMNSKEYYVITSSVKQISTDISTPGLVSAKYSNGAVTVTWNKVSGVKGYYVYRKVSGGKWGRIKNVTSGSTVKYVDSSVESGKTYVYTVRAYTTDKVSECNTKGVSASTNKTYSTYVTNSRVNYRTGAGLDKKLAGTFAKGTSISVENGYSITADGYTWYRFKLNSKEYYIVSKYIKKK